jgi:hypothetical protein
MLRFKILFALLNLVTKFELLVVDDFNLTFQICLLLVVVAVVATAIYVDVVVHPRITI